MVYVCTALVWLLSGWYHVFLAFNHLQTAYLCLCMPGRYVEAKNTWMNVGNCWALVNTIPDMCAWLHIMNLTCFTSIICHSKQCNRFNFMLWVIYLMSGIGCSLFWAVYFTLLDACNHYSWLNSIKWLAETLECHNVKQMRRIMNIVCMSGGQINSTW